MSHNSLFLIINILQARAHFSTVYIVPLCNGGFADFKDFVAYLDGIGIVVARQQCAIGHGECGMIFLTFVIHNQRQGCNCLREEDDR